MSFLLPLNSNVGLLFPVDRIDVMASLNFGSETIDYTIKKGKRKRTVAIQVISPSQVVVLTPHSLSREKIEEIVRKRSQWILQKQERLRDLARLYPAKEFVSGERLLYLGRRLWAQGKKGGEWGAGKAGH